MDLIGSTEPIFLGDKMKEQWNFKMEFDLENKKRSTKDRKELLKRLKDGKM